MIGLGLSIPEIAVRRSGTGTPTPTPTPAPSFTTQPSISPSSGNVGNTFTASDGVASNSTGLTRRWLLGVTQIGTGTTVVPVTTGSLTLEVTATGPGGSTVATSAAVTISAGTIPNYRVAFANAKNGTSGPLIINVIGDSTTVGQGGGTGTPATPYENSARYGAINQQLGTSFAASGLSKNGADIFGFNFPIATQSSAVYATFNPSVTVGGWTYTASGAWQSLGGSLWTSTANDGDFVWTAEGRQFDKLTIYYAQQSGNGTFGVYVDGVQKATYSCNNGSLALVKAVVPGVTLGTHTVSCRWLSGGKVMFVGMETLDTTNIQSVRVRCLGQASATSAILSGNQNAWDWRNGLALLDAAHLHIVEGGLINDWRGSVGASVSAANFTTLLTAAQTNGGDALILGATRQDPANAGITLATQDGYVAAVAALANGTTKAFYDLKTGVGDYTAMNGAGRMYDQLHPNLAGYAAEAAVVYGAIT